MQLRYIGPIGETIEIPALRLLVEPGEPFTADGEIAASLLDQPSNFERVDVPAADVPTPSSPSSDTKDV